MSLTNKGNSIPLIENSFNPADPTWTAYERCLRIERSPTWNHLVDLQKGSSEAFIQDLSTVVTARVLGHGLRFAPCKEGRDALTREINDCGGDPELLAGLAYLYVYGLIRVFYNPKGSTPSKSADQSPRYSFTEAITQAEHLLEQPSISTRDLRQLVGKTVDLVDSRLTITLGKILLRDNSRCVLTGIFDFATAVAYPAYRVRGMKYFSTDVAHIITLSLSENISGPSDATRSRFQWATTAAAILERFGNFSAKEILGEMGLNSPLNAFTVSRGTPHDMFDSLDLYLTPAKDDCGEVIPHTYDVIFTNQQEDVLDGLGIQIQRRIEFNNNTQVPPPDPRLLALHAACAQIAHMSGAAEYLQEIFRDCDDIKVMTEPNAAYELARALKAHQIVSSAP